MDIQNTSSDSSTSRNLHHQLQICRDITLSQETLNREFSRKALIVIGFSATLFGSGIGWAEEGQELECCIVLIMGVLAIIIAILGLVTIVKPRDWKEPRTLEDFQKITHQDEDRYLITLVNNYKTAQEANADTLKNKRGSSLKLISWLAVTQLFLFAVLGALFVW